MISDSRWRRFEFITVMGIASAWTVGLWMLVYDMHHQPPDKCLQYSSDSSHKAAGKSYNLP
jgi:hypothetical protein